MFDTPVSVAAAGEAGHHPLTPRSVFCVCLCSRTAVVEAEELSWIQSNLDEVISMLQQQSPAPPLASEVRPRLSAVLLLLLLLLLLRIIQPSCVNGAL